jgi:hypothetical protein
VESAVFALRVLAQTPDGATACLDVEMLHVMAPLCHTWDSVARTWTCELLGELARHPSTAAEVLKTKRLEALLSLLRRAFSRMPSMHANNP